jgi:hypothetical protein
LKKYINTKKLNKIKFWIFFSTNSIEVSHVLNMKKKGSRVQQLVFIDMTAANSGKEYDNLMQTSFQKDEHTVFIDNINDLYDTLNTREVIKFMLTLRRRSFEKIDLDMTKYSPRWNENDDWPYDLKSDYKLARFACFIRNDPRVEKLSYEIFKVCTFPKTFGSTLAFSEILREFVSFFEHMLT